MDGYGNFVIMVVVVLLVVVLKKVHEILAIRSVLE